MIFAQRLTKTFAKKTGPVRVLTDVELSVEPGEFVAIKGSSGCGKTTLLLILGGLLHPSEGEVRVDEQDLYSLSYAQRTRFRGANIGFVFQTFHLLPYLTVTENVLLASAGRADQAAAAALLERLRLGHRIDHRPSALSAGEQQRTAIARAMVHRPKMILADEPTGNLDPENSSEVFAILRQFRDEGGTVVAVTHGTTVDAYADRTLQLQDGQLAQAS